MGTDKEGKHAYADAYERHLGHLRDRPIKLLEIGVGGYADRDSGGASLRMWKEFFPRGEIVGIDIHDKSNLAEERVTILKGDQSDGTFIGDVGAQFGPFDVVIDDGSHVSSHVLASFLGLFPYLKDDGIYVIEDLQASYWKGKYGGSSESDRQGTSMTFLQGLVDGLNYAEFDIPNYVPSYFDVWVRSLTFYHNIAFVHKGANLEGSNYLPPHPRPGMVFGVPTPARPRRPPPSVARRLFRRLVPRPIRAAIVAPIRRIARATGRADRRSRP
jgi:hypothetical protein